MVSDNDIVFRCHPRARHYTIRVGRNDEIFVTVPRGGTQREAKQFVEKNRNWIALQRLKRAQAVGHISEWREGTEVFFRGEKQALALGRDLGRPFVALGDERIFIADAEMNLRRPVETFLLGLARSELPALTREMARLHDIGIRSVSVRNQSSRWGSCSSSGAISLNWRLVQTPTWVRDYLIIHELMHRREMNHSMRFWRHVAEASPRWREAEIWLDSHAFELGMG